MSSTNRSRARDSHISDYYITPIEHIKLFLDEFAKHEPAFQGQGITILDPCSGGDEVYPMSYPEALHNIQGKLVTVDIRDNSRADIKADYTQLILDFEPDIIITNPPFNRAIEIIGKALADVKDNGFVIMLLRLNYFGTRQRKAFWSKSMPKYCFIHHVRMGFNPDKKGTDSVEYCHMVWQKGYNPEFTLTKVI